MAIGTHWVDMDIVMDKDGEIVVSHDILLNPDISRGPDGKFLAPSKSAMTEGIPPGTFFQLRQLSGISGQLSPWQGGPP